MFNRWIINYGRIMVNNVLTLAKYSQSAPGSGGGPHSAVRMTQHPVLEFPKTTEFTYYYKYRLQVQNNPMVTILRKMIFLTMSICNNNQYWVVVLCSGGWRMCIWLMEL